MMEQYHYRTRSLNQFFSTIYFWMMYALGISAVTSWIVTSDNSLAYAFWGLMVRTNGFLMYGLIAMELVLVWLLRKRTLEGSHLTQIALLTAYAALSGLTLSVLILVYTPASLLQGFVTTVVVFAVMSAIGYFTTYDLTTIGGQCTSALLAAVVVSLFNIFVLRSEMWSLILSIVIVVIFVGLTAYDTQRAKRLYAQVDSDDQLQSLSIWFALELYLDFINLFIHLMRIFGKKR